MKTSIRFRFLLSFFLLVLAAAALAQNADVDPPSRVARLQFMEGQVSLQPGGVDEWAPASFNRPLTTADRLWTDQNSRAELSLGSAAFRLNSETAIAITNLNDQLLQLELDQGSLNLSVRFLPVGESIEIDTPNFAFSVRSPGEYHFDTYPGQDRTDVSVIRGWGEVSGSGYPVDVRTGMHLAFSNGQSLSYRSLPWREDGFDRWSQSREAAQVASVSARYVPAGMVGFEDLDANGDWGSAPSYGMVWYPRVHSGWAPYREGHWAWVEPWGWTWVDDASWGFAPFHYGRWVNVGGRWGWTPGPATVRPVYAPALVAWVGNVSIAFGGGPSVGWVPLGWRDPYFPAYHASPLYARRMNECGSRGINITIVNNYYSNPDPHVRERFLAERVHYDNMAVPGAVVVAPHDALAGGRSIRDVGRALSPQAAARVNVNVNVGVVPTRQAVFGGHAMTAASPRMVMPQHIVAHTPPPARPANFDQRQAVIEHNGGLPPTASQNNQMRNTAPMGVRGGPVSPANNRPSVVVPGQPAGARPAGNARPSQPAAQQPSGRPTTPTAAPSNRPSPYAPPTGTVRPTQPATQPSGRPTTPTAAPSNRPSPYAPPTGTVRPSQPATQQPSGRPTTPTAAPSNRPSPYAPPTGNMRPTQPAAQPSGRPTTPNAAPSSGRPAQTNIRRPNNWPSQPAAQPSSPTPSRQPSSAPSNVRSPQPSVSPNHPTQSAPPSRNAPAAPAARPESARPAPATRPQPAAHPQSEGKPQSPENKDNREHKHE